MRLGQLQAGAGDEFLFHYTDAARANAIIEERCFVSGPGVARGLGIYATDIAPTGLETIEDVIVHCFRGEATPPEVNHGHRSPALSRRTTVRADRRPVPMGSADGEA